MSLIEFWKDYKIDLNINELKLSAVPVKGVIYYNPCRILEIYEDFNPKKSIYNNLSGSNVKELFLPKVDGININFGPDVYQPPYNWFDCPAGDIAVNFTYAANAVFRILNNLKNQSLILEKDIDILLDKIGILLAYIYKISNNQILKYTNNNINMYIISKAVEYIVGKKIYNSKKQEIYLTNMSLDVALNIIGEYINYDIKDQMAFSLGIGVSFIESQIERSKIPHDKFYHINEKNYKYIGRKLSIDDRQILIDMVASSNEENREITMCAILDDTTESVADLLWMQNMLIKYPLFKINLILNTAQISINFSYDMFNKILKNKLFKELAKRSDKQVFLTKTLCPLISFQINFLTKNVLDAINKSDFVYVKGANFFETCQIIEKPVFYAFVVYGNVSRKYTGLNNFDAVFSFIPKSISGYVHNKDENKVVRLIDLKDQQKIKF